jgi:hypothetical protein
VLLFVLGSIFVACSAYRFRPRQRTAPVTSPPQALREHAQ